MNVLQEILKWSQDRHSWQQDALRRLVENDDLTEQDIIELTEICKSTHGLVEPVKVNLLSNNHTPDNPSGSEPVSLDSIFHHRGVNALAEDQTLKFSPSLTIVYGDNGAGKTGYIRILKSACRARGQEEILGNVVSGTSPLKPVVKIKYIVGSESEPMVWTGSEDDDFISRVSVFDSQSASVYLTEKTDIAFRPFGLDLFDKLVKVCKSVRKKLEDEQKNLTSSSLDSIKNQIPPDTGAAKLLANISSLTKPETVLSVTRFSPEEESRLALLEKTLLDWKTNDPAKLSRELNLRLSRIQILVRHLNNIENLLSPMKVGHSFEVKVTEIRKSEEAKNLRAIAFSTDMLMETGSESWATLWEAARKFSQEAYPDKTFPVVESGARCVFCQQNLDYATVHRLQQFEAFVASSMESELRQIKENFSQIQKAFSDLKISTEAMDEIIKEIRIDNEGLADAISSGLLSNEKRRQTIIEALSEGKSLSSDCPDLILLSERVNGLAIEVEARIKSLQINASDETRKKTVAEVQELKARKLLTPYENTILDDIERRKKYAAYGLCIDDTKTQAITQKSSSVTKTVVSQRLKQSFQNELENLSFHHIEVAIKEVGGSEGVLFHKLVLTRAPNIDLPTVVSEGEQRCLSIAAFFAELSTADDPSGIVFDDPVSSLDYRWREAVARRLVKEANTRQVIVFTHDIVFLLLLKQFAKELNVEQLDQHVRFLSIGAGVCEEDLPWVAMPVNKKIGSIKNKWTVADKLFREGHQDLYEKEAKHLYGLLREAWERAIEEVLLGGNC